MLHMYFPPLGYIVVGGFCKVGQVLIGMGFVFALSGDWLHAHVLLVGCC